MNRMPAQRLAALGFRPVTQHLFVKMMGTEMTITDGTGREKSFDFIEELLPDDRYDVDPDTDYTIGDTEDYIAWQNVEALCLAGDDSVEWRY